ncbi:MAG: phosphoenolpyruvate carboxykinase (ATP) [Negativicutes bacterium]|nr:phosphoenolpyruvate carboxykinase (ATP) [Negativicutes bacterium]MDR3591888.1 phosphoenolpyruvate carboxykinase (ATP) [Negativicutes bacterium]
MAFGVLKDLLPGHSGKAFYNLTVPKLVEEAIVRGEGAMTANGALRVVTGKYTGRSPDDKFTVKTPELNDIWWQNNKTISEKVFDGLYNKVIAHLQNKDLFIFEGCAGADPDYAVPVRIINEFAWQNIFVRQMFVRPDAVTPPERPGFTVIGAPGCIADPAVDGTFSEAFVVVNFAKRLILVGGSHYAGEMKKSIFSVMNYLMPKQGILSMHCSANKGADGDTALFFGLSGTGKTSLSADPDRQLIGDDEHCWSDSGIFNVEGGCYAKCVKLTRENEPQIWDAIKFGSVLENVVMNEETREVDYDDESLTENTRAAYPIDYIPGSVYPGVGRHPSTIVFLTADAFGVLPPIAKLSPEQAMYYFMSGYTSKLAGTERGITEPQATFSSCFGAPFLPLPPLVYANLLKEKISKHNTRVFLINTGWQGGAYGVGKRISIQYTRRMVAAAINGDLDFAEYVTHPIFNLAIPAKCPGVPDAILMPQSTWSDQTAYEKQAERLAGMFHKNFAKFPDMPQEVVHSGPFQLALV